MCAISIVQVLMTFNAGLYEHIGSVSVASGYLDPGDLPSRVARRTEIIKQMRSLKSHVICLQEIWFGEDVGAFVEGLQDLFPYSYSPLHDSVNNLPRDGLDNAPPCDPTALGVFSGCLTTACPSAASFNEVTACAFQFCAAVFAVLGQECWNCLGIAGSNPTIAFARCAGEVRSGLFQEMNPSGLLLLSSTEMSDVSYVDYHPNTTELLERGYLKAEISDIGELVCTHTTSYDNPIYTEPYLQATGVSGWVEQGVIELSRLIEDFSDRDEVFLLGDFNVGPEIPPSIVAATPVNYAILTSAFSHHVSPQCTFCTTPENSYNYNKPPVSIDHIFYKGHKFQSTSRVLDGNYVDGQPLSDHYGVVQRFTRP